MMPFARWTYTALLTLLVLLALPFTPLLMAVPRWRRGLLQRLGFLPPALRDNASLSEGCLWVHAASLGEVNAIAPVVRRLQGRFPRWQLVITCTTGAGQDQATRLFPRALAHLLLPLDLPFLVDPWVRRLRPRLTLVAETELWPNFFSALRRQGSLVMLANARMSERSAKRYAWVKPLFEPLLRDLDGVAAQSQEDAERFLGLGARQARVKVTGNTKFDQAHAQRAARLAAKECRRALGWNTRTPVLVAGSTRPGEEEGLLDAYLALRKQRPELRLVLAPRHPQRVSEVERILKAKRLRWQLRSTGQVPAEGEVLLLDTLGELSVFYRLAWVAWIGGSFADFGGQNPLESAGLAIPTLFGPSMRHFKEPASALLSAAAAAQAKDMAELQRLSAELLDSAAARKRMGLAGSKLVRELAGASAATADLAWRLVLIARLRSRGEAERIAAAQGQLPEEVELESLG